MGRAGGGVEFKEVKTLELRRYVAHDFLIGHPVLIDRLEKTMTFYKHNIYGQIYNLKNPEHHVIGPKKISGLIRRTNNPDYSFANSFAVDGYIYTYLMTPEQQAMCRKTPSIPGYNEFIAASDDYGGIIRKMCEWVYEHEYRNDLGDKETECGKLLKYCDDFLSGRSSEPPQKQEPVAVTPERHDHGAR